MRISMLLEVQRTYVRAPFEFSGVLCVAPAVLFGVSLQLMVDTVGCGFSRICNVLGHCRWLGGWKEHPVLVNCR